MMLPRGLPAGASLEDQLDAYTPAGLHQRLRVLMDAEAVAVQRGYDLVAKLYASEWQMLFLRYSNALAVAEEKWDIHEPL